MFNNTQVKKEAKSLTTALPCSHVTVCYESSNGSWRGFVLPYAVTYEADTREEVLTVLKDMIYSYEEGLRKYNSPYHLKNPALTYQEDIDKFAEISYELISKLLVKETVIDTPSYYAEAKLPAEEI